MRYAANVSLQIHRVEAKPVFLYSRGLRPGKVLQDYIVVKRSAPQERYSSFDSKAFLWLALQKHYSHEWVRPSLLKPLQGLLSKTFLPRVKTLG